jgi:hypothetical protein
VRHPPKVDVIISETFGNFALEETIIGNLNDARKRFLKPKGTIIPCALRQYVAPVVTDRIQRTVDTWAAVGRSMDWSPAREVGMNNMYVKEIRVEDLLSDGTLEWDRMDCRKHNDAIRKNTVEWRIGVRRHRWPSTHGPARQRSGGQWPTIQGFALWWEADLIANVTLSTSPYFPATHWQQIYLPLPEPLKVQSGDCIELQITADSRYDVRINVAWKTVHRNAQGKMLQTFSQDMRKGFLQ